MIPTFTTPHITLYTGHVLDVLREIPADSVDCVVTSPPYWGLRDYGVAGQLGLEATPDEYVAVMVEVFREVRRVLRADGTLWVNLGDSYASGRSGQNGDMVYHSTLQGGRPASLPHKGAAGINGLKPKDLVGIPWRVAFALQADGWYLRSDIVWSKPNPMPESVTDRPTKAHEYVFLLTKSERYFYDADAIRTPLAPKTFTTFGTTSHGYGDGSGMVKSENWSDTVKERRPRMKTPDGWDTTKGEAGHGSFHKNGREKGHKQDSRQQVSGGDRMSGFNARYAESDLSGANARSVWEIATQPYPEAHFATFPEELPRRCIKAGCPPDGVVLDPFAGSGTTLAVARDLGRRSIGIELNPAYVTLIEKRCAQLALEISVSGIVPPTSSGSASERGAPREAHLQVNNQETPE